MKKSDLARIERKIVIGCIVDSEYLKKAYELIDLEFVQSKEAKIILGWVFDFYKKFKSAPKREMEDLFFQKLKTTNIQKDSAKLIEETLNDLSEEYDEIEGDSEIKINVPFLLSSTLEYAKATKLKVYTETIQSHIETGNTQEAEKLFSEFKPIESIKSNAVTPLGSLEQIKRCFETMSDPVLRYPGSLGSLLNNSMVKAGFVTFLAQNKGGKSFFLLKSALMAAQQGKKVVYFDAGDMSEEQINRRIAISLAKKSDLKMYTNKLYIPVLDCVHNQTGECDLGCREMGGLDPFEGQRVKWVRQECKKGDLVQAYEDLPGHVPCYNCKRDRSLKTSDFLGCIWYKEKPPTDPLHWKEIYQILHVKNKFKYVNNIELITYPSETLSISKVYQEIELLEKGGFTPDIVIIDYLDLCAPDNDTKMMKSRDIENKKWQRVRRLSQEKDILILSASQSDAQGFEKKFLTKKNFSEDRRKLDHVTAMYGLNMSDSEKVKGIVRVNDVVARETEGAGFVYVFQRLQIGQPILGSFF